MYSVSTFWMDGSLSPLEHACLKSFVRGGAEVILYHVGPVANVPAGVSQRDARLVDPEGLHDRFFHEGRPTLGVYSDYFRFKMLSAFPESTWVDADVVCLAGYEGLPGRIIGVEDESGYCAAVLRFEPGSKALETALARCTAMAGRRDLPYGTTGKMLLMDVLGERPPYPQALPASALYPVHYRDTWKLMLPRTAAECRELCAGALSLHLWNHVVEDMGIHKHVAPPEGSFLHQILAGLDCLDQFSLAYSERTMERLVENYLARDGRFLPTRGAARLIASRVKRSLLG